MNTVAADNTTKEIRSFSIAKWSIFGVFILSYILVYFHRMAPGVVSQDLIDAAATTPPAIDG